MWTECVIEGALHAARANVYSRGFIPIDFHLNLWTVDRQIARDVPHPRHRLDFFFHLLRGFEQLRLHRGLHGKLIQALGHLTADANGGRILQIDLHAGNLSQLRLKAGNDLIHAFFALSARLEPDQQLTEVWTSDGLRGCAPNRGHQGFHIRVVTHDGGDGLLVFHHLKIGSALQRFRDYRDLIGVLLRNKALRNNAEQVHRSRQHQHECRHGEHPVTQHHLQGNVVGVEHPIEELFGVR